MSGGGTPLSAGGEKLKKEQDSHEDDGDDLNILL